MQFLYADGTDAHFMDERVLRADRDPGGDASPSAELDQAEREVDLLFIDDEPADVQLAGVGRARGHRTPSRACAATPPRAAAPSPRRSRPARPSSAAVRQHRRPGEGRHALGRLHVARVGSREVAPQRPAPRRRLRALPARPHRPPARRRASSATRAPFTRALAHATLGQPAEELDELHRPPRRGLDARAHRAAGARDPARRAAGDAPPRRVDGDQPIPPEGAIDEAVETAKDSAAPRRRASSTASSPRCCARCGENGADQHDRDERDDPLDDARRAPRATRPTQLRAGELAPRARPPASSRSARALAARGRAPSCDRRVRAAGRTRAGDRRRRARREHVTARRTRRRTPTTCAPQVEALPRGAALRRASPPPAGLEEAMRYSLLAGGKRIRPVLALATAARARPRAARRCCRSPPRSS